MDIKKLTQEVLLKNMTPEQQMAVLDSVQASVKEAKAVQKQKIAENVDLVLQALKRIEADMIKRVDGATSVVEARVKTIKDGKDGKNGIDGKVGRDGKDGKNGADGRNGKDGINGVSGERGQDGVGVQNAHIDFDGSLIIALTDGRELNVGEVVPFDVAEKIRVIGNGGGTSQFVIDTLADLQTQIDNFQALPSQTGNAGKFLTTNGTAASWASVAGGLSYQGTWNASTNSPTLTSSAGTNGYYYIVGTAGSTNLNGITDWQVGDWLLFNGSTWQKLDQTNSVTSVAGRTGAVTIGYSDLTGTTPTWNQNTTGTASNVTGTVAVANGGTGSTTASGARTNLGLGTIATQNATSVAVTGGAVDGTTVGATTAAAGSFTTLIGGSGSANYSQITGGATTKAVEFKSLGSDTNVSYAIQSKGTGAIDLAAGSSGVNISNGGTVTAITRTAQGSGYSTLPTVAITAPTTAGGVQATASPVMVASGTSPTITSGGTGYTVNDVLTVVGGTPVSTAATITVTSVSGGVITGANWTNYGSYTALPTNPVSVTGGTGTGATFTASWSVNYFTITNAGSGYVEQPTVTFSGGGGSGAAAYVSVGSTPKIQTLGANLSFFTPAGEQFRVSDTYGSTTSANYIKVQGRSSGGPPFLTVDGSDANPSLGLSSKGSGAVQFFTNSNATEQLRISHTASAVNYVQVTGAATAAIPTISSQGSDASVSLNINGKGGASLFFSNNGGNTTSFRVNNTTSSVNYPQVTGGVTGSGAVYGVAGTDTNIDLTLTPKGTGVVQFGTYTATGTDTFSIAGYVTIKDSAGNSRKLAVIA